MPKAVALGGLSCLQALGALQARARLGVLRADGLPGALTLIAQMVTPKRCQAIDAVLVGEDVSAQAGNVITELLLPIKGRLVGAPGSARGRRDEFVARGLDGLQQRVPPGGRQIAE